MHRYQLKEENGVMFEIVHSDICLPDYWAGHHRPHIAIPVHKGMTLAEIKQLLKNEVSEGAVMGSDDNAFLLSSDFVGEENESKADNVTRAVYAAIDALTPANKRQKRFFTDLENDHGVMAFFVFYEVEK